MKEGVQGDPSVFESKWLQVDIFFILKYKNSIDSLLEHRRFAWTNIKLRSNVRSFYSAGHHEHNHRMHKPCTRTLKFRLMSSWHSMVIIFSGPTHNERTLLHNVILKKFGTLIVYFPDFLLLKLNIYNAFQHALVYIVRPYVWVLMNWWYLYNLHNIYYYCVLFPWCIAHGITKVEPFINFQSKECSTFGYSLVWMLI